MTKLTEDWDFEKSLIKDYLWPSLEKELGEGQPYLAGEKRTIADLAVYNELATIEAVSGICPKTGKSPAKLADWYAKMAADKDVKKGVDKMRDKFKALGLLFEGAED